MVVESILMAVLTHMTRSSRCKNQSINETIWSGQHGSKGSNVPLNVECKVYVEVCMHVAMLDDMTAFVAEAQCTSTETYAAIQNWIYHQKMPEMHRPLKTAYPHPHRRLSLHEMQQ